MEQTEIIRYDPRWNPEGLGLRELIYQEDEEDGEWFMGYSLPWRINSKYIARVWWALTDVDGYEIPRWTQVHEKEFVEWLKELGFTADKKIN